jgi:hypothetical protein
MINTIFTIRSSTRDSMDEAEAMPGIQMVTKQEVPTETAHIL